MLTILNIGVITVSWTVVAQLDSYVLVFSINEDFYLLISYTFRLLAKINLIASKKYKHTPQISYTWMPSDTDFDVNQSFGEIVICNIFMVIEITRYSTRKRQKYPDIYFLVFFVAIHSKQNEQTDDVTLQNTFQFIFWPHLCCSKL